MRALASRLLCLLVAMLCSFAVHSAATTNALPVLPSSGGSAAVSVFRVIGALCLVFAVFFGGTWLFRNWARFNPARAGQRKLHLLEARSLGGRQSVLVVAYDKQRFLIGSTPQGMTLLSHLPEAQEPDSSNTANGSIVPIPFTDALMQALGRK